MGNVEYAVIFMFYNRIMKIKVPDMSLVVRGFYIDNDECFTDSKDWSYWIPSSQILHIQKVKVKEGEK